MPTDAVPSLADNIMALSDTDRAVLRVELERRHAKAATAIDPTTPTGRAAMDELSREGRA